MKNILALLLLLPCSLWGRNAVGGADGSDWKKYSQSYKVGLIDGFLTSMSNRLHPKPVPPVNGLGLANESSPDAFRRDCTRHYCGWL